MSNEPTPDAPDAEPSASAADDATVRPADPTVEMTAEAPAGFDGDTEFPEGPDVDSEFPEDLDVDREIPEDLDVDREIPENPPATSSIEDGPGDAYIPTQPPPYAMVPPIRRLVRDPYSRLGGVCSGIAHHTGVDVSLVRLGFVLATVFSGIGLILYLLAWLIVPRAEYWPPAPYESGQTGGSLLEGRRLAYGLLGLGIVLVIVSGAGGFARMLIAVGLVGAGIWLLVQPQSESGSPATGPQGAPVPASPPVPQSTSPTATPTDLSVDSTTGDAAGAVPSTWQPSPGHVGPDTSGDETVGYMPGRDSGAVAMGSYASGAVPPDSVKTVYVPSPVPPRRRRIWPILVILAFLLIPVVFVVGGIIFLASGDPDFSGGDVVITPLSVAEIPEIVDEGAGTITLDLTNLDAGDFTAGAGAPQEVDIDLNAGEVTVDLPADFPVAVDASAGAGEITVLENYEEGIRPRITIGAEDAVLELDIRVGVGTITVDQ